MAQITRNPVKSSNIASVGYDEKSHTMEIEFIEGGVFQYNPVTPEGYRAFIGAKSLGSYFFKFIKHNETITCTKVS